MRTVRRKGAILLNRYAAGKCTVIEKSVGEKADSPKEKCDFGLFFAQKKCICRMQKSVHSGGTV